MSTNRINKNKEFRTRLKESNKGDSNKDRNKNSREENNEDKYDIKQWEKAEEKRKIIEKERQKKMIERKEKEANRKLGRRILAGGLAVLSVGPTVNGVQTWIEDNQQAQIDQVLENGTSLEELGLDDEIVLRIHELETMLERDDLTDQEVKELSVKINELQFDVIEGKLAKVTGEEDISLGTQYLGNSKTRNTVETTNNTYVDKDMITNVNTISPDISKQITNTRNMQKLIMDIQNGKVSIEQVLNKNIIALKEISQFAGMKLQMDGKRNITAQKTRIADLSQEERMNIYNQAAKEVLSKDADDELEL